MAVTQHVHRRVIECVRVLAGGTLRATTLGGMAQPRRQTRLQATLSALRSDAIATAPTAGSPIRTTRVAIIGLGRQGSTICDEMPAGSPPYGIAGACRQSSVLEVVAGADILPDKRLAFQEKWGREIPGASCLRATS